MTESAPLDAGDMWGTVSVVESVLPSDSLRELAHELRSPLMALAAACDLVDDEELSASMRLAVSHMRGLIAVHLERQQAESLAVPGRCGLARVVSEAVDIVGVASSVWVVVLDHSDGAYVGVGDLELRRAVVNVVANAVRFSPAAARVEVNVRRDDYVGVVEVRDFGPGVPLEALDSLGVHPVESSSGFGVGLFLARSLAESVGGSVCFELADPGLLVRICLPLVREEAS